MDREENQVPMTPPLAGGNCTAGDGMPAAQPLAMAYVPMQEWRRLYTPADALKYGTLFEELNLPFLGSGVGGNE